MKLNVISWDTGQEDLLSTAEASIQQEHSLFCTICRCVHNTVSLSALILKQGLVPTAQAWFWKPQVSAICRTGKETKNLLWEYEILW